MKASPESDPKTDRDDGAYLDSLGWVYYRQKKPQAKQLLEKAVEDKDAPHIEIYDDGAIAAWRKGLDVVG